MQQHGGSPHGIALHPWCVLSLCLSTISNGSGSSSPLILGHSIFFPSTLAAVPPLISPPSSGNPGLLDFYVPFLNAIHREAVSESTDSDSDSGPSSSVTIFAHAHLGLSSYVGIDGAGTFTFPEMSSVTLPAQVQAHVEFLDEILAAYGPATRVLLVGHSIGAWFIQEVLKARASLRPRVGAYMLFPTLSHIGKTPGGRMLSVRVCTCHFDLTRLLMPSLVPGGASRPLPSTIPSTSGAKASISPAVAPHTSISHPARPARSPVHPLPRPALLARKPAGGHTELPARTRGYLRVSGDGA